MIRIALALAPLAAVACVDEGVGDPCIPEAVPCNAQGGNCGYLNSEAYIEASSVQCKSRLCLVYHLDNGTNGLPADPRVQCKGDNPASNCVSDDELNKSVYCTCRCGTGGNKSNGNDLCTCGDGFDCLPILNLGGAGIVGSYCVKHGTDTTAAQ